MPSIGMGQIEKLTAKAYDTTISSSYNSIKKEIGHSNKITDIDSFSKKTFNIHYWEIRNDDGSGRPVLKKENAFKAHKDLNKAFNDFNICFNIVGYDTIQNSDFERTSPFKLRSIIKYAKTIDKHKENAINVYLFSFTRSAGIQNSKGIGVGKFQFRDDPGSQILIHEMGHFFGLSHPHSNWHGNYCEHVTRDKDNPNYNANKKGDKIDDTNATPNFVKEQLTYGIDALRKIDYTYKNAKKILQNENGFKADPDSTKIEKALLDYGFTTDEVNSIRKKGVKSNAYVDFEICQYLGKPRPNSPMFKDCQGTPYNITDSEIKNYMVNSHKPCQTLFTIGQKLKMLQTIENSNPKSTMAKAIN